MRTKQKRPVREMTGRQLFLRYTYACMEYADISPDKAARLRLIINDNSYPSLSIFQEHFPNALCSYREWSRDIAQQASPKMRMWSRKSVSTYWRNYHSHPTQPRQFQIDTWHGHVKAIEGPIITLQNGQRYMNVYGLPIAVGDQVYGHKQTIVEFESPIS
ncbi:MAG: hypothetical protein NTZ38_01925 [Candidatus Taylorbacteria bacterium]|nr:hypothetical protein [Candidatus Taylorbacteria bacterium]